jgi:hypothetical protein
VVARYSHHLDESFKGSFACKVVIVSPHLPNTLLSG